MTDDDIAARFDLSTCKDKVRDIKVLITGVMEISGCKRHEALRFITHQFVDMLDKLEH